VLPPWTLKTRSHSYTVEATPFAQGAICDLYASRSAERLSVIKMPRSAEHNDRIEREAMILRRLSAKGDKRFVAFVPNAYELCRAIIASEELTCLVIDPLDGFYTLAEVMRAYPGGIGPREAAWMWRRLLIAIGFAHEVGVIHSNVEPHHVMIHPEKHGLVLVGWGGSVNVGEISDDGTPVHTTPLTDIRAANNTMLSVLGDEAPQEMRAFSKGCHFSDRSAWELKEDYDILLERLFGRRKFHPFTMPGPPALNRKD
jgi:serine/threonine protein kinase